MIRHLFSFAYLFSKLHNSYVGTRTKVLSFLIMVSLAGVVEQSLGPYLHRKQPNKRTRLKFSYPTVMPKLF